MKSFAYSEDDFDSTLCYQIWYEVEKLKMYFYKFCGNNADEAMQLTLTHAMTHYNRTKGDLIPYIKTLAREITKSNGRVISCDFLEQTATSDDTGDNVSKVDLGQVTDISNEVIDIMTKSVDRRCEIAELALQFMNFFMLMCQSLINKDTTTIYFPDVFISECLTLSSKCANFNNQCLLLYDEFKDSFDRFLNYGVDDIGEWRETDCDLINKYGSKRVKLISENGSTCDDPDTKPWIVSGNLKNKRIIKIPYYEQWDKMCDLIDEDSINCMKFTIDFSYIIVTLGGSRSVVNPSLFNEYDLCKSEILTNLLYDTYGRYLSVGSKCMYFLVDTDCDSYKNMPKRRIRGVDLQFAFYDVTPE